MRYKNGNASVEILENGTRIVEYEDSLNLDYPLNIDIRVSTQCSFGYNPKTKKAKCEFCHENATTNGKECDYIKLKEKLENLPKGIELAIGGNQITYRLMSFLQWASDKEYICNLTINQGHIKQYENLLIQCISQNWIKGLGISYRSFVNWNVPDWILNYEHTVFHVIAGIDNINEVLLLKNYGVKKILVLGEKDHGFNLGNVNLQSQKHKEWRWFCRKLFDMFDVVVFDNLALDQLKIKRFIPSDKWDQFYQGEHSMYIDAVNEVFSPSSRSSDKINWDLIDLKDYFKTKNLCVF